MGGTHPIALSWDAFDGSLGATIDGTNLWPAVIAEGLWEAGRGHSGYAGYAIDAMQHGLDRIAFLLESHPEMLPATTPASIAGAALVDVAKKMLAGEIGAIEGSRKIARLRFEVEDEENEVFLVSRGIESESDNLVVGDRALWAEAFLADIDRRYRDLERAEQPHIGDACRALLAVFLPRLHG